MNKLSIKTIISLLWLIISLGNKSFFIGGINEV